MIFVELDAYTYWKVKERNERKKHLNNSLRRYVRTFSRDYAGKYTKLTSFTDVIFIIQYEKLAGFISMTVVTQLPAH